MTSDIDPARDICENAFKVTAMVLFINFYILEENFL